MSDHTLGLLRFREQGEAGEYCLVTDDNRWVISFRLNGEFMPQAQDDIAIRIVSSMNACAGLPLETIKDKRLIDAIDQGLAENLALEMQRDELLAAAKNLRDVKGRHHSEQAFNALVAVIAKVETKP